MMDVLAANLRPSSASLRDGYFYYIRTDGTNDICIGDPMLHDAHLVHDKKRDFTSGIIRIVELQQHQFLAIARTKAPWAQTEEYADKHREIYDLRNYVAELDAEAKQLRDMYSDDRSLLMHLSYWEECKHCPKL